MAPKGKKGKKQQDDWEAELGEDASAQQNGDVAEQTQPETEADADGESGGGGLLAALKKNKEKRKKKGKQDNDFVEGEDLAAIINGDAPAEDEIADKAPVEATFDDEDVFAGSTDKKGKGGRKESAKPIEDDDDNDSTVGGGGVKSKKEKEKEKKEREKARKKEQVSRTARVRATTLTIL